MSGSQHVLREYQNKVVALIAIVEDTCAFNA